MLETERLLLRPHRLEDFDPWFAIQADPQVRRFIRAPEPSPEDGWNRLLRYAGHWALLGSGMFAVFEKVTGCLVGDSGIADFHRGLGPDFDGFGEAAWMFAPAAQGKGYASEAARAVHLWMDRLKGRPRTVCIIDPENAASCRVAEKLGYRPLDTRPYRAHPVLVLERSPV